MAISPPITDEIMKKSFFFFIYTVDDTHQILIRISSTLDNLNFFI